MIICINFGEGLGGLLIGLKILQRRIFKPINNPPDTRLEFLGCRNPFRSQKLCGAHQTGKLCFLDREGLVEHR